MSSTKYEKLNVASNKDMDSHFVGNYHFPN